MAGVSGETYPAAYDGIFEEKAPRLELLIRLLYGIVLVTVGWGWGIAVGVVSLVQFFHILFLVKRRRGIWDFVMGYLRFTARVQAYLNLMTDQRPPITGRIIPLPRTG